MTDLTKNIKKDVFHSINCIQVGKIDSYDKDTATASIKIMVKRVFQDKTVSYPLLLNCPVFALQGGVGSVYMPVQAGDDCIVLFADRNIDIWHSNGIESAPANTRCHDLADGIALVGIRSLVNAPVSRATGEAGIANGGVRVALASNKANIENATTSLLKLIEGLIDVLKTISVDPSSHALIGTVSTNLEAQKTEFAKLLFED